MASFPEVIGPGGLYEKVIYITTNILGFIVLEQKDC